MTNEKPILDDPDQYPTDAVIYCCVGKKKALWTSFFDALHERHPEFFGRVAVLQGRQELADESDSEIKDDMLAFRVEECVQVYLLSFR